MHCPFVTIVTPSDFMARKNALSICHNCHAWQFCVLWGFTNTRIVTIKKGYLDDERWSLIQIAYIAVAMMDWLSFVELLLALLATWALPVVRQVFECHTVVLIGVIYIAADRTDILARSFVLGEVHLGKYGGHRMV